MAKPVKSQWDFGELFPAEPRAAEPKVLSVSELTVQIRRLLEQQIGQVHVTGEITNLRLQSSGHSYFTLKDASSQLSCVLFRGQARADRSLLQDGRKVVLQGELTVYEPRGQYQLIVSHIELQGVGALQAAFEKLKQKLNAAGLFASERKRPLPRFPQRVGLVTSPTGAAIRDVLHVIRRRQPGLEIVLVPCRVQGEGAASEIAGAVRLLNEYNSQAPEVERLDLILLTRGGGSLEDLWAFNEEVVAQALFESLLPVVSAVGHEIDFTISDFVADVRAATPSAGAEIITEGPYASLGFVAEAPFRLRQLTGRQLDAKQDALAQAQQRLGRLHPRRRFQDWMQRLDEVQARMSRCVRQGARQHRAEWQALAERLSRVRPAWVLKQRQETLRVLQGRLREQARQRLDRQQVRFETLAARLRLLGPDQVLARGYSITSNAVTGKVIRSAAEVSPGLELKTRLHQGEISSRAEGGETKVGSKPRRPKLKRD